MFINLPAKRISPDNWFTIKRCSIDQAMPTRTNLSLYLAIRAYCGDRKPPRLVVWGKKTRVFRRTGPIHTSVTNPRWSFISSTPATSHLGDRTDEMIPLRLAAASHGAADVRLQKVVVEKVDY
jgi:hypothetical protein